MASRRSPSVASQYNDDLSSPDPLATSVNDEQRSGSYTYSTHAPAPRRSSTTTTTNARRHTKSNSQSIEVFPSSPFRSVSEQNLSPWKIRVTVEAEPEDADMEGGAPVTRARTRTTKIPLQADSSPIDQAKGAARGKKPQVNTRRSGTPERKGRTSSRTRRQSVTDLDIIPLGDDAEEDDWLKQKRSPKKRRSTRKSTAAVDAEKPKSSSPSKSRSKSSSADFEIRPDTDAEAELEYGEPGPALGSESPELQKLDLNQISIRPRALSTKSKNNEDFCAQKPVNDEKLRLSSLHTQPQARKVSANSAMSYPTPSPTSSYHGDIDDLKAIDDGFDKNEAGEVLDTILESEGFTMIDLDTLPSAKRDLSSPVDDGRALASVSLPTDRLTTQGSSIQPNTNAIKGSSSSLLPIPEQTVAYPRLKIDESEISSTVPSSPPSSGKHLNLLKVSSSSRPSLSRKVTPLSYSSPKLPSPPRHEVRQTPHHQHRASAGALFAGIALQEIVSPEPIHEKGLLKENTSISKPSGPHNQEAMFTGFDSGTQRELRAGLRFGEELAKRQVAEAQAQPSAAVSRRMPATSSDKASKNPNFQSRIDEAAGPAQNPPATSPNPCSTSSRSDSAGSNETPQTPENRPRPAAERSVLDTQARREAEWQLEREAISRQIQNASESQVIVIDSDSEDEVEAPQVLDEESRLHADDGVGDETDIWLAEAKSSSSPPHAANNTLFTRTEQEKQRERAKEVVNRPRRSLIPSPWKRGEDVEARNEQSSYLSTSLDEMTGLNFYSDPQTKKQQLEQRRNSGKFDIDLMAGTPKKEIVEEIVDPSEIDRSDGSLEDEQPLDEPETPPNDAGDMVPSTMDEHDMVDESENEFLELSEARSSPADLVRIPVNFNDSSISISTPPAQAQPPQLERQDRSEAASDSPPRPPTPRSAMKGARGSFHQGMLSMGPDTPTMIRKVIFSERSRGVDVDGQESSFSMRSSSDDTSFGDEVGRQLRQELHAVEAPSVQARPLRGETEVRDGKQEAVQSQAVTSEQDGTANNTSKAWNNWIWGSKQLPNGVSQMDGQSDNAPARKESKSKMALPTHAQQHSGQPQDSQWQKTKSTAPSSTRPSLVATNPETTLPSYLLPPSYPSDPLRSTKSPLSLSGEFTNTHFRTLHIIYRKSLRPKFHPPPQSQIRDEVWSLRGKEFIVDESKNGLVKGEFVWTVGDGEAEVLERFMQEVEFSNGWFKGVKVKEGAKAMQWAWTAEELCGRLCRIVVGEAVREEERKVREKEASMVK
ncbi:hypothetical protein H2200_001138 [Cladophialophora chaetospira]|uniref:AT DNA binding protein n=1 Tax=Cladophialophora chaetospira TaxID=386627 RepID=A0AA38XKB7_9EURO|nr:hypothetical protein H2200_001138 [Cladophialophora chaetospira]